MNKIIIIGNGFDRAHGLKTGYPDFIKSYIHNFVEEAKRNHFYHSDQCIDLYPVIIDRISENLLQTSKNYDWFLHNIENEKNAMHQSGSENKSRYKSNFLRSIIKHLDYGWVDIENTFFEHLFHQNTIDNEEKIINLNKDLECIKEELIKYLIGVESQQHAAPLKKYLEILTPQTASSDRVCILNFNYTNTAQKYYDQIHDTLSQSSRTTTKIEHIFKLINIHGDLYHSNEDVIFGIGDEHHDEYKKIKDHKNLPNIVKNSKSFWYLRNTNYMQLINFINSFRPLRIGSGKSFDIEVLGHSCGLSDRTLLKYLFQHPNLNKIILHHYNTQDNYIKMTYEAWRHFEDSQDFRERIVPFDEANRMPQYDDEG